MSEPRDGARDSDRGGGRDEAIGSLGEETAKLFGAFAQWTREQAGGEASEADPSSDRDAPAPGGPASGLGDLGAALSGLAGQAAAAVQGLDEHIATGSAECTYCPVCRTIHLVRSTSPEVRAHLTTAFSSLVQAAGGLLATLPPPGSPPSQSSAPEPGSARGVERIDLDASPDDDLRGPDPDPDPIPPEAPR